MIDFKNHCCICGKLGCSQEHTIDEHYLCQEHRLMVIGFMTYEGADDDWHFYNEDDLKLM